ncbi:MAG: hypothetical protein LBH44_12235 [Treponema sp.]|nr:hypothetical protein [Treponema sp.]
MKRLFVFFLIIMSFSLYAQDAPSWANDHDEWENSEAAWVEDDTTEEEQQPAQKKKLLPIEDRAFEIGLLNLSVGFANDFITASQIFQETMVIDLDELHDGMKINLDVVLSPLYFTYSKSKWGFGLFTGVETMGIVGLSGNTIFLNQTSGDKSEVGGAAFVDVSPYAFFHIKKLKVKIKPSVYYPLMYVKSDISYVNKADDKPELSMKYDVSIYTPFPLEDFPDSIFDLNAKMGFDFHLGAEYPLSEVLGLKDKFSFLDFDVGLDLIHLPMIPATLSHYMKTYGYMKMEGNFDLEDMESSFDTELSDMIYGQEEILIFRPFKMLFWADWRPFKTRMITFVPALGFSINPLYLEPFSIEANVKTRLNLANMFLATAGIGYEDRLWKNSINLALNLRIFEFDLGVDFRSQDFLKSFSGGGFGVSFGFKFGW